MCEVGSDALCLFKRVTAPKWREDMMLLQRDDKNRRMEERGMTRGAKGF